MTDKPGKRTCPVCDRYASERRPIDEIPSNQGNHTCRALDHLYVHPDGIFCYFRTD